jgi:hypothetical protein
MPAIDAPARAIPCPWEWRLRRLPSRLTPDRFWMRRQIIWPPPVADRLARFGDEQRGAVRLGSQAQMLADVAQCLRVDLPLHHLAALGDDFHLAGDSVERRQRHGPDRVESEGGCHVDLEDGAVADVLEGRQVEAGADRGDLVLGEGILGLALSL